MSGVIGKGNKSYIKQQVGESLLGDFNVTNVKWANQVTAAQVTSRIIDFTALNFPVANALRANGFANPVTNRITSLGVSAYRANLTVISDGQGEFIDFQDFTIQGDTIVFEPSVTLVENETIVFTFNQNVQNGNRVVNARPLRKSAIIPSQRTRAAIGATIEVAPSILNADGTDNQQIGNIQVFVEGLITFRNPGNLAGDANTSGNYREVFLDDVTDAGIETANVINNGTANAIEFNEALSGDADTLIISTNLIVDSETNTISTLTNSANTKLNELPTIEAANAGQFLAINADGSSYETRAGVGALLQVNEVLTSATITVPNGAAACKVTAAGGGGGGGQGGNSEGIAISSANGGNAAEASIEVFNVGAGADITTATISVVIGAGGAGATGNTFSNTATNPIEKTVGIATSLTSGSFVRTWAGGNTDRPIGNVNIGRPVTNRIGPDGQGVNTNDNNTFFAGGGGSNTLFYGGNGSSNFADSSGNRLGGGGGGGAGYFAGSDAPAQVNTTPQDGGAGGNGGMLIEWYSAITIN